MNTSSQNSISNLSNVSQLTISNERLKELRNKIKKDSSVKFKTKKFMKENGLDPAYMNFYKFIKDDSYPLPLLGFLKMVEANSYKIQLCITEQNVAIDDSGVWGSFLDKIEASVESNIAIEKEKDLIMKRDSLKKIKNTIINDLNIDTPIDVSDILDNIF